MRQDARSLLKKLDLNGFRYTDYHSDSDEAEQWPFFAALLIDDRVVGRPSPPAILPSTEPAKRATWVKARQPENIFQVYDRPLEVAAPSDPPINVKDFLGALSGRKA